MRQVAAHVDRVVSGLIEARQLDSDALISGRVVTTDLSRRNQVTGVLIDGRLRLVAKGFKDDIAGRELAVYAALAECGCLGSRLPSAGEIWDGEGIWIGASDGRSLGVHRRDNGHDVGIATELGLALRSLHGREHRSCMRDLDPQSLPAALTFRNEFTGAQWWSLSGANRQLLAALAQAKSDPLGLLEALSRRWEPTTPCHGDIKAENIIIDEGSGGNNVVLIDWELAGLGDPGWDVGCVLADAVWLWIDSMPVESGKTIGAAADQARESIAELDRWVETFALAYGVSEPGWLWSPTFAGARLLQAAWEIGNEANRVTPKTMAIVQAGTNLLHLGATALVSVLPRTARTLRRAPTLRQRR